MRYRIRLRSEMAQQHAAHLFRLLRTHSQKHVAQLSTGRPGLRCFFITLEASKRGFYLVAKQLVYPVPGCRVSQNAFKGSSGLFVDSLLPFKVPERVVSSPRRHSSASCHIRIS